MLMRDKRTLIDRQILQIRSTSRLNFSLVAHNAKSSALLFYVFAPLALFRGTSGQFISTSPPLLRNERRFRYRTCLHLAEHVLVLLCRLQRSEPHVAHFLIVSSLLCAGNKTSFVHRDGKLPLQKIQVSAELWYISACCLTLPRDSPLAPHPDWIGVP